jgi:ABC-type sugar transport system permease subunit
MKRNDFGGHGIPTFFKVWFAFVAVMAICVFAGSAFMAVKIFGSLQGASPETIGAAVGKAVAAYQMETK